MRSTDDYSKQNETVKFVDDTLRGCLIETPSGIQMARAAQEQATSRLRYNATLKSMEDSHD